jgi:hypothetical protein
MLSGKVESPQTKVVDGFDTQVRTHVTPPPETLAELGAFATLPLQALRVYDEVAPFLPHATLA